MNSINWTDQALNSGPTKSFLGEVENSDHKYLVFGASEAVFVKIDGVDNGGKFRSFKAAKSFCEGYVHEDADVTITDKEKATLLAIFDNEFSDGTLDCSPWTWSVADGNNSIAGCLASLQAKGFITTNDAEGKNRNRDMYCTYTHMGKILVQELLNERKHNSATIAVDAITATDDATLQPGLHEVTITNMTETPKGMELTFKAAGGEETKAILPVVEVPTKLRIDYVATLSTGEEVEYKSTSESAAKYRAYRIAHDKGVNLSGYRVK